MKQALLIFSFVIAAFIAACSNSTTKIPLKMGGNSQMSVEQLEKASSDDELKKFKTQLEKNKNIEIPDIIKAVKAKFDRFNSVKEQPKSGPKDTKKLEALTIAKDIPDEKLTKQPAFDSVDMIDINSDPTIIYPTAIKDEESKHICIQTCEKQIIILRKKDKNGKIISISAFVAAEISEANAVIVTKTNKTLKSIEASFDIRADQMALKFNMTKDKKAMILNTVPFTSGQQVLNNIAFMDSDALEFGTFDLVTPNKNKIIRMRFDSDKDIINIKLKDDLGIFGKNKIETDLTSKEAFQVPSLNKNIGVRNRLEVSKY